MNSSSRSYCSCCQSWDSKGPCRVADLKGNGSFLPGIPWLHGEHSVTALLPHKQGTQQQVPITSSGKKEGSSTWPEKSIHGLCEPLKSSKHFGINSRLLSVPQAGQSNEEQNHRLFKTCTVPITWLTTQGMVLLSLKLQHDGTCKQALF